MMIPLLALKLGKRKRFAKGARKALKKTTNADTENDESEDDEEPSPGPKKKKVKSSKKSAAGQDQGKGSATITSSMGCTRILEVMTQPLPFPPLGPLGHTLTQFMPTMKGTNKGD
jgi:hypothetical protein